MGVVSVNSRTQTSRKRGRLLKGGPSVRVIVDSMVRNGKNRCKVECGGGGEMKSLSEGRIGELRRKVEGGQVSLKMAS